MKKSLCLFFSACMILGLLAACGGNGNSAVSTPSAAAPSAGSQAAASAGAQSAAGTANEDLQSKLPALAEAAGLGADPRYLDDIRDFTITYKVEQDSIVSFAAAESKMLMQTGGAVVLVQAQPGRAEDVRASLEAYRDATASNDLYAEYQDARENVANARIQVFGDVVVYAVSATGEWDALDAAIAAAFA